MDPKARVTSSRQATDATVTPREPSSTQAMASNRPNAGEANPKVTGFIRQKKV